MEMSRKSAVTWILAIVTALTLGAVPAAHARSIGNTVNGCQAQWWNTAFSLDCRNVTVAGQYRSRGACTLQVDRNGPITRLARGETRNGVSPEQCTFSVTSATASFLGS